MLLGPVNCVGHNLSSFAGLGSSLVGGIGSFYAQDGFSSSKSPFGELPHFALLCVKIKTTV